MKIALVHDYLVQYGGAERVLECFLEMFPYASIYTLIYDEKATRGRFSNRRIYTSFLQKLPFSRSQHRIFPPLMPLAIEQFDFSQYDIVLSDSSSFAKGIITKPETLHICYMHTPMRYAWDDCQRYTQEFHFPTFVKRLVPLAMNPIRMWDRVSADRPDYIVANSDFVARRIQKYYRRSAEVIHPPVAIKDFYITKDREEYYLVVGRLIAYKRHDLIVDAFNKLGRPITIIGRGPELKRLQKKAKKNIVFLERVDDEELAHYYAKCKAFIFPQEEDFGIVAIEALASGRPVIAYYGGDIPQHVEEGKSGIFFYNQTPDDLVEAVKKFESMDFDPEYIRKTSLDFDREHFKRRMQEFIDEKFAHFKSGV